MNRRGFLKTLVGFGAVAIAPAILVSKKVTAWVSVYWFGARGDGITDDTAAIQQAIDAVRPSGTVHFPKGNYRITGKIHGK